MAGLQYLLLGALEPCINSSGKAALFQTPSLRQKVDHKKSLMKTLDRNPPFLKLSENVLQNNYLQYFI